jgi:hypothetical protein
MRSVSGSDDAEALLMELVAAEFGSWQSVATTDRGGRPSRAFHLRDDFVSRVDETPVTAGKQQGFADTTGEYPELADAPDDDDVAWLEGAML